MLSDPKILRDALVLTAIELAVQGAGPYKNEEARANLAIEVDRARYLVGIQLQSQRLTIMQEMRAHVVRVMEDHQLSMLLDGLEEKPRTAPQENPFGPETSMG